MFGSDTIEKVDKRNHGIDLLRIISMFFVVLLHVLGHGGVLQSVESGSTQYGVAWFLEIFAIAAVDIFALISGFVMYSDKKKPARISNYIILWLEVVFYSVIVWLVCNAINPEWTAGSSLVRQFFPVTNNLFWYFTAYTGLFLLMPLLNAGLRSISKKNVSKYFILLFIGFSIFGCFSKQFQLDRGYSLIWISILYIMGALLKKGEILKTIKIRYLVMSAIALISVMWLYKMFGLNFKVMNIEISGDTLVSYVSPTVLGIAVLYVVIFSRLNFKTKFMKYISKFGGKNAFAVYLLNDNRITRAAFVTDKFSFLAYGNSIILFLCSVGYAAIFTVAAILIDKAREFLFKKLRLRENINKFLTNLAKRFNIST